MRHAAKNIFPIVSVFVLVFFCMHVLPARASGTLAITEIMYDASGTDTDHEWIEIYNGTGGPIDLTKYRYNDSVSSSNHTFNNPPGFPAGSYAVLVDNPANFLAANPAFSGVTLLDTVLSSLNNTGGTLKIMDCSASPCVAVDTVTYASTQGASGDGNSLQKNSAGAWIAAVPTPGSATTATTSASSGGGEDTTNTSGGLPAPDTSAISPVKPTVPQMQAVISALKNAVAGVAVPLSVRVTGYGGEYRGFGVFHFAFGDGTGYRGKTPEPLQHVYEFPGTYVVSFDYRSNPNLPDPEIFARATVEVFASPVHLSVNSTNGAATIENSGTLEMDISNWTLVSLEEDGSRSSFVVPEGTIVLPGKSISISKKVDGLLYSSSPHLELLIPSGAVAATYGDVQSTDQDSGQNSISLVGDASLETESYAPIAENASYTEVQGTTLAAAAANAFPDPAPSASIQKASRSIVPYMIALGGIIIGSIIALKTARALPIRNSDSPDGEEVSETEAIARSIRIIEEDVLD